jgi:hypothetical protein
MLGLTEALFVLGFLPLALIGTVFRVWMLVECASAGSQRPWLARFPFRLATGRV